MISQCFPGQHASDWMVEISGFRVKRFVWAHLVTKVDHFADGENIEHQILLALVHAGRIGPSVHVNGEKALVRLTSDRSHDRSPSYGEIGNLRGQRGS